MTRRPELVLIAAVGARNRVIGHGLDLPWRIPADLRRFKSLTLGHPLLMGRRTFESLVHQFGGPLKGRRNVVVSTHAVFPGHELAEVFLSIEEALDAVADAERVFIGGGASIYAHFLPIVDRLELTLVEGDHEGDVFFPPWEHLVGTVYDLVTEEPHDGFRFCTYVRRGNASVRPGEPADGVVSSGTPGEPADGVVSSGPPGNDRAAGPGNVDRAVPPGNDRAVGPGNDDRGVPPGDDSRPRTD